MRFWNERILLERIKASFYFVATSNWRNASQTVSDISCVYCRVGGAGVEAGCAVVVERTMFPARMRCVAQHCWHWFLCPELGCTIVFIYQKLLSATLYCSHIEILAHARGLRSFWWSFRYELVWKR